MHFAYTIVYVADVTRAVAFYERALGLQRRFIHESGSYAEMETGSTTLAFSDPAFGAAHFPINFRFNQLDQPPAAIEIAFTTPDVPAAFAHAIAAGATPFVPPQTMPWGQTVAYIRDPDGVLVEIATPMG